MNDTFEFQHTENGLLRTTDGELVKMTEEHFVVCDGTSFFVVFFEDFDAEEHELLAALEDSDKAFDLAESLNK